ncbi:MAG: FG-GAP-like repeat-containing protein [Acidobacteriota bacterium]|nr:FG-GAP-like repeat-containing protein [Acidobacteriota bacterium]
MFSPSRYLRLCASLLVAFAICRVVQAQYVQAQNKAQFVQPLVELTGGRVTAIVPGFFQPASGLPDLLYLNGLKVNNSEASVTAGLLLNHQGFTNLVENQIIFRNVFGVSAAVADLNQDNHPDLIFGLAPLDSTGPNLCVFYGTGASIPNPSFLPTGQLSGCVNLLNNGQQPNFAWLAAAPFTSGALTQLFLVDRTGNLIYVVGNNASPTNTGALTGFHVTTTLPIPAADGAGPIYTADLNRDGKTDLVLNNQGSNVATVYLGNGDGSFQTPVRYAFDHHVHSLQLYDFDRDGQLDMLVEGDGGGLEIFPGRRDGTFASTPVGAFPRGGAATGGGGHLAAVGDIDKDGVPDILVTTPAGMSVLVGQPGLRFALKAIYNIGPGRATFVVADLDGDGNVDVAVDSAEGVAVLRGNGDGSFQSSLAYAVGAPALNAVVATLRDAAHNPNGYLDAAVATGLNQAQVLTGDGTGAFVANAAPVNAQPPACVGAGNCALWSKLLAGDFDGDGHADLLFSLTGLPLPAAGTGGPAGLALAYGRGDGTFEAMQDVAPSGTPMANNFAGESAVADVNGDGVDDIFSIDASFYDTLLGQRSRAFALGFNLAEDAGQLDNRDLDSFSQVAVGAISAHGPDAVFQDDGNLIPFLNSGDGVHFTRMDALPNPPAESRYYENTVLIADVDGDGHGDIVVPYHALGSDPANPSSGTPNLLYIWYGNGDGTFAQPTVLTLSRNFYLAQAADMDNDGLTDLVLSDGYVLGILYNNGSQSFGVTDAATGVTATQDFLAGQGINSISVADVNHDGSLDVVVATGGPILSAPVVIGGRSQPAITLAANANGSAGGITVLLNAIHTQPVTGTLTTVPSTSRFQGAFTATAALAPSAAVPVPTGTVQFAINGTAVGEPVPVIAGATSSSATYTVAAGNTYQGTTTISATYSGDARNSPLTLYATQDVTGSATSTTLALCVGPSVSCPITSIVTPPYVATLSMYYGQEFNGSAGASSSDGSVLDPKSTIAFNDAFNGAAPMTLCTLGISFGSACPPAVGTTVGTATGTHVFTAVYSGDATHAPSTSLPVTLLVTADPITAYTLTSSANPASLAQPVTFTATLTGNYAAPTGTYPVLDNGVTIGSLTLTPVAGTNTSTGTFTTSSLAAGTHPITAPYPGTVNFQAATSPALNQVIQSVVGTVSRLTSSVNPSAAGQAVTFTDVVTPASGASTPVPTGTVTFTDGASVLGRVALNGSGVAVLTTSGLSVGSHAITATSAGDTVTAGSSATLTQVVTAAAPAGSVHFSVTANPSPASVGVGNVVTLTVSVSPVGAGTTAAVTLSCSGLPYEAACQFANPVIPAGGGTTTLVLSATAPHSCGTTAPYFVAGAGGGLDSRGSLLLPGLAALLAFGLPGRRRWMRALVALLAVASVMQLSACGTCTDLGTRPATYTIGISGASAVTAEVEGTTVTLNVHL